MSEPEKLIDAHSGKRVLVMEKHFKRASFVVVFPMEVPIEMDILPKGSRVQFLCEGIVSEGGNLMVESSRIIDMSKELARCYIEEAPGNG